MRTITQQAIGKRIAGLFPGQPPRSVPAIERHPDLAERMERVAALTPERAASIIREGAER